MIPDLLKHIIADQKKTKAPIQHFKRQSESKIKQISAQQEIVVLAGVHCAGKSVLLQKIRQQNSPSDYYFNFDDKRLVNFKFNDFQLLQEVFIELYGEQKIYYLDEIHHIDGWEFFIKRLYNAGNKIYLAGSDASIFKMERYSSLSVYPFSFYEFVRNQAAHLVDKEIFSTAQVGNIKNLFNQYYQRGGFIEYAKHQQMDYLHALYNNVIYRDIIVRYKIPNAKPIKELVFYLASHCGKEVSYNALRRYLGLGSATTISDYCGYLESSFLCFFVSRYSESAKAQMLSAKKIYFIDHALARIIGYHSHENKSGILKNIVFIELKRRALDIYYHQENKECDFLISQDGKISAAMQVCQNLQNADIKQPIIAGLLEALERYSLSEGLILTEHDEFTTTIAHNKAEYKISVMPIWKWLLQND